MKKLLLIPVILLVICPVCIQAQNNQPKLNQVELMKKFTGTWQREGIGKDTLYMFELQEYNNAILQINSSIIKGVKSIQHSGHYNYDPESDNYKCYSLSSTGQFTTWRTRFISDKEIYFERVEDLKTNKVILRNTITFNDRDHLTGKNYTRDKVLTSSTKWVRTSAPMTNIASDLPGTYEYTGNQKGISIWDEKYFIWMIESKSSLPDSEITPQSRLNSMNVAGGTWTVQDSIFTCTYQYHINPKMVGTSFRWMYIKNGNIRDIKLIDGEGRVIGRSSSIKIN
jgi:hypothetical protein